MVLAAALPALLVLVESIRLIRHSLCCPLLSTSLACLYILLLSVLSPKVSKFIRQITPLRLLRFRQNHGNNDSYSSPQSDLHEWEKEKEGKLDTSLGSNERKREWILVLKLVFAMNVWMFTENQAFNQLPTTYMVIIKSFLPPLFFSINPVQPVIFNSVIMAIPSISLAMMVYTASKEILTQYNAFGVVLGVISTLAQGSTFIFIDELYKLNSHDVWESVRRTWMLHFSILAFLGAALLVESAAVVVTQPVMLTLLLSGFLMAVSIKLFSEMISDSSPLQLSLFFSGALVIVTSVYMTYNNMIASIYHPLGIAGSVLGLFVLAGAFATSKHSKKLLPVTNGNRSDSSHGRRSTPLITRLLIRIFYAILLIFIITSCSSLSGSADFRPKPYVPLANTNELRSHNVSAVIFYGRRESVRILNCYLERNLAKNGGILSEVIFVVKTDKQWDLDFLEYLLERNQPYYRKIEIPNNGWDFSTHYSWMTPNTLYFKVDDDIIYIRDGTFEELLTEKLRDRYIFLSANVVNHPILAPVHGSLGAIAPYTPSFEPGAPWIRSKEPLYLNGNDYDLKKCAWENWKCAMLSHENFLYNMEHNMTWLYDFPIYDFHAYDRDARWSINFFILNSSNTVITMKDDEQEIAVEIPKRLGRHCAAVGKALVVHYGYYTQRSGLDEQNHIMSRYAKLAKQECGFVLTGEEKAGRNSSAEAEKSKPVKKGNQTSDKR
ncbi:hypothetical protein BKA69DRAFT_1081742 [Paraphysoderma sedebokerense]|nr:hypothetical protein BKA69DRAFT_1081742 [Paraphysoderma sedebokerense]